MQGPTVKEMVGYAEQAATLVGDAWRSSVSPFAVFGEDRWLLNVLFMATILVMAFNLAVQAPKQ